MNQSSDKDLTVAGVALRFGIVALALGTAYIHSTLGGLLFTLNAVGYAVFAIAMIVPISLAVQLPLGRPPRPHRLRATTIVGWAIQGPYYSTAYIAKGIEVALIVLVAIDFLRADGNPVVKVVKRELKAGLAKISRRRARPASRPPDRSTTRPGARIRPAPGHPPPPTQTPRCHTVKRLIATLALATVALAAAACSSTSAAGRRPPRPLPPIRTPRRSPPTTSSSTEADRRGPGRQAVPAHLHQQGERAAQRGDLHRRSAAHEPVPAARSSRGATRSTTSRPSPRAATSSGVTCTRTCRGRSPRK